WIEEAAAVARALVHRDEGYRFELRAQVVDRQRERMVHLAADLEAELAKVDRRRQVRQVPADEERGRRRDVLPKIAEGRLEVGRTVGVDEEVGHLLGPGRGRGGGGVASHIAARPRADPRPTDEL